MMRIRLSLRHCIALNKTFQRTRRFAPLKATLAAWEDSRRAVGGYVYLTFGKKGIAVCLPINVTTWNTPAWAKALILLAVHPRRRGEHAIHGAGTLDQSQ